MVTYIQTDKNLEDITHASGELIYIEEGATFTIDTEPHRARLGTDLYISQMRVYEGEWVVDVSGWGGT